MDKPENPLDQLYRRPGFLTRRANQIAVWLFLDEAAPLTITTTQYGALVILNERNDMDQIGLAKLLRMDKSTTAMVVSKLEAAGLARRDADPDDRRRKLLRITTAGRDALRAMAPSAERARDRLLAALSAKDAQKLLSLLQRYVSAHEGRAAAPPGAGPHPPAAFAHPRRPATQVVAK